ncbi:polysaccharide deacetylase family protein [Flavobacterium cellulosilyticum]|uniref:Polysaccharide deacetylase family protein n=1 Tax=Flavobacterium cellulosilyticum TaxID=2541731 RepID=A0A4R5CCL6_9FLAO|nr:polysaccharide deacetylase family protein [Flavobacterium cellulosilyticum]TDD96556.1 polysaccharide deacetylase family protein [Flavobacterium cellulosilyticum]
MKFYWIKTNSFIKQIFSNYIWAIPNNDNKVYLTFDDGPTPEITEWVLQELKKYNAKATFFCIGKNIEKHPDIFSKVITEGHSFGNHTFNHLNGWKSSTDEYLDNLKKCEVVMSIPKSKIQNLQSKIFRPPYGKIKPSQSKKLRQLGYKIIMWDVLSADFDTLISKEKCLENVLQNVQSGSIIVFHDNVKAFPNLEYTLPKSLMFLKDKGFVFETLN